MAIIEAKLDAARRYTLRIEEASLHIFVGGKRPVERHKSFVGCNRRISRDKDFSSRRISKH